MTAKDSLTVEDIKRAMALLKNGTVSTATWRQEILGQFVGPSPQASQMPGKPHFAKKAKKAKKANPLKPTFAPRPQPNPSLTRAVRQAVYERAGHACEWCWRAQELEVHHIKPKHMGGVRGTAEEEANSAENLALLCRTCHEAAHGGHYESLDGHSCQVCPLAFSCEHKMDHAKQLSFLDVIHRREDPTAPAPAGTIEVEIDTAPDIDEVKLRAVFEAILGTVHEVTLLAVEASVYTREVTRILMVTCDFPGGNFDYDLKLKLQIALDLQFDYHKVLIKRGVIYPDLFRSQQ